MFPTSVPGKGRESIFETALKGPQRRFWNPWCLLVIFQGTTVSVVDNSIGRGVCWKIWEKPWCLATKVLDTWRRLRDPRWVLQIFGRGSRRLWLMTSPDQRAAAVERYYWLGTDFCWRYMVGSMSVWDIWVGIDVSWRRWCHQLDSWGGHAFWLRMEPVDNVGDVVLVR